MLNQKGYKTQYCCEGHEGKYFYITFWKDYNFQNLPAGIIYSKRNRSLSYKPVVKSQNYSNEKTKSLELLLDYINNLEEENAKNKN